MDIQERPKSFTGWGLVSPIAIDTIYTITFSRLLPCVDFYILLFTLGSVLVAF